MKRSMKIVFFFLLIIISIGTVKAQESAFYPFSNSLVLSLNGGFSKGETDYSNSSLGIQGQGKIEYFFQSKSNFSWGLKLDAGYTTLNGKDAFVNAPENFESALVSLGTGISANYNFDKKIIPFISLELQNLWVRDETALNYLGQLGVRYILTNYISLNGSLGLNFVNTDHIDNLKIDNTKNDYYTTFSLGVSYAIDLRTPSDLDEDGISDSEDSCPNEKEDFDGFKDYDGCADLDNDDDGILDINDECPDKAEDFDGFKDNDGCPDLDNDDDGILDEKDECLDTKEDYDGFQDEDGCPDLDNDNDGILDENDKCPNKPETFNSFEDNDGCPDKLPDPQIFEEFLQNEIPMENTQPINSSNSSTPNEFFLSGESTFSDGSATIRSNAHLKLNQIAGMIKNNPGYHWKIEGHMDNSGSPFAIKALSTARANSVMNYLVSAGVSQSIFEVVGLGDKYPTSSNSTENGRKENRRVIIKRVR